MVVVIVTGLRGFEVVPGMTLGGSAQVQLMNLAASSNSRRSVQKKYCLENGIVSSRPDLGERELPELAAYCRSKFLARVGKKFGEVSVLISAPDQK